MNRWECCYCESHVLGCGAAIGLRAIGWYVLVNPPAAVLDTVGLTPGSGPLIACPRHYPLGGLITAMDQARVLQASPLIEGDEWVHPLTREGLRKLAELRTHAALDKMERDIPGLNPPMKQVTKKTAKTRRKK